MAPPKKDKFHLHQIFFLLLLFFLPTQLGKHFWPDWTMVLGRRVDYLSPTLFMSDLLCIATILFFLFPHTHRAILKKTLTTYRLPLTLLLLLSMINTSTALSPILAITGWVKVWEYLFLGWYMLTAKPNRNFLIYIVTASACFFSLLGLVQMVKGGTLGGIFWWLGERSFSWSTPGIAKAFVCIPSVFCHQLLRPYSTLPHPNVLAGIIGVGLLLWISKDRQINKFKIGVTLFLLFSFLLTFSRESWIAFIGALFFFVLLVEKRWWRKLVYLSIIGFSTVVFSLRPFTLGEESITIRTDLNHAAFQIIRQHGVMGVGLKNFLVALPSFIPTRTIYFLQPVHSIYLLLFTEVGLVGCGILFLSGLLMLRKQRIFIPHSPFLSFADFLPLFFLLLIGLFDHYLLTTQQGQLLFLLVFIFPFLEKQESIA